MAHLEQSWFRRIVASNMLGIGMWRGDGSIAEANDALLELLGYTREDLTAGQVLWRNINPPEFVARDREAAAESHARGHCTPYEKEYVRKDGTRVPVLVGGAFFDPGSGDAGILFALDISRQRRAEARLQLLVESGASLASSLDYETTLRNVARLAVPTFADWCSVRLLDDAGAVQPVAVAHRDPAREELARELARLYPVDPAASHGIARVIRTGVPILDEAVTDEMLAVGVRDDEHLRRMRELAPRSRLTVPLEARGRIMGALTFIIVTPGRSYRAEDVPLAEELGRRCALAIDNARLHLEAQLAVRSRDEFLSIASHELRTPVTSVRGYAQLVQRDMSRGALDEARLGRAVGAIVDGTERLTTLTRDLLDVSRIRTGQLSLRPQPVDLAGLVKTVVSPWAEHSEQHRLRLDVPPAPCRVLGDADRLTQVLTNLLDNAFKYSPGGGDVAVSLAREEASDHGWLVLRVRDDGIGIPVGSLETVFQPFARAPNARMSPMPGMGLGLFVCRSIVERHGGRLWAESDGEGRGTTIVVVVPAAPPEGSPPT